MLSLLKRIAKHLPAVAGVLIIVLALIVGAFRLLIGQLPGYQLELQAWVAAELGVEARFTELDARLGLLGPELSLGGLRLSGAGADRHFLEARRASITLDPWRLLLDRRVTIARLTLDAVSLEVERSTSGVYAVPGLNGSVLSADGLAALFPPTIDIVIRDGQFLYVDRAERRSWQFVDLGLTLERSAGVTVLRAQARPPAELGELVEFTLNSRSSEGEAVVTLTGELTATDFSAIARLLPEQAGRVAAGHGDLAVRADWAGGVLANADFTVELNDVVVAGSEKAADYERLAFIAHWMRADRGGFALSLEGLDVVRAGRPWPRGGHAFISVSGDPSELERVVGQADFLRLEDIAPIVTSLGSSSLVEAWTQLAPTGDLSALNFTLEQRDDVTDYEIEAEFSRLGISSSDSSPGFAGLSGEIRARPDVGTVNFSGGDVSIEWPKFLDLPVSGNGLRGTVVWRRGQDAVRIVSDDLSFEVLGETLVTNFELGLPADGSGPILDAEARIDSVEIVAAKSLIPKGRLPSQIEAWVESALVGGIMRDISIDFVGPISAFPFDGGEGQFVANLDVEDATIEFIPAWPVAENLSGHLTFENASFTADGGGSVLGNVSEDFFARFPDLRSAVLQIEATTTGALGDFVTFLQTAPPVARHLGAGFDRLHADGGTAITELVLDLPLYSISDFALSSRLTIADGELRLDGFGPVATEVSGALDIRNSIVNGEGISAFFLGGPVVAEVHPAEEDGYRSALEVRGETTSDAVLDAFTLPFRDLLDGQTIWEGRLLLPHTAPLAAGPMRIEVETNLSGVALRFPDPVAKSPGEPMNLKLGFTFADDGLEIAGNLGASRRFELAFDQQDDRFLFTRGVAAFGGDAPVLPLRDGIVVSGHIPHLRLDDWLTLANNSSIERARPLFYSADLDIGNFSAFGQMLGSSKLSVQRGDRVWAVEIASEAIAGRIEIPQNLALRSPVIAEMDRIYLATGRPLGLGNLDPRDMPALRLRSAAFGVGARELGRVEADVVADPLGLRLTAFSSATENFELEASGSWLHGSEGSVTRIAATVESHNVAATLEEFGLDSVMEGEAGELTASVYWNGPPAADWLDHLNGDVTIQVDTGSLIEIDPGAGRVVGLMSIAALPRRLALDFRDVFNKGFVFDEIAGNFTIIDGNAFTDNLKLTGPTAEIGVIGRTGLRDRDYQQQAVVTVEPSNMLPTVGGLIGGPGVGAALLIFTQIFKEPLKGIGRASYCVTGAWDEPVVERITADRIEDAEQCVSLPDVMIENGDSG